MPKYTIADVEYLADCIRDSKERGEKPIALLLGAGISKSAGIPLSHELVGEINNTPRFSKHLHGLSDTEKCNYPHCMARLTKENPASRRWSGR